VTWQVSAKRGGWLGGVDEAVALLRAEFGMTSEYIMRELTTEQVELWAHLASQQQENRAKQQAYEIARTVAPLRSSAQTSAP